MTLWSDTERAIWEPTERLSVSQWADRYFRLPSTDPKPGARWRTFAYQRDVLDAFNHPDCEEIVVSAGAQNGKSRCVEIWAGYTVDVLRVNAMLVFPRGEDVKTASRERLRPLVERCEPVARQTTGRQSDFSMGQLQFRRSSLFLASAGSPADIAGHTCPIVLIDEVSKIEVDIRSEGSPLVLAIQRTNQFEGRRKIGKVSTPRTQKIGITIDLEASDYRRRYIPCPHCGVYQPLEFSQVKWPEDCRNPDMIFLEKLAWYECIECGDRWTDADKVRQDQRGVYVQRGASVDKHGNITGGYRSSVWGFEWPGLLSPFRTWSDFAARFLRAKETGRLSGFFRNDIGIPWEKKVEQITVQNLQGSIDGEHKIGDVPPGTTLCAGADIGKYRCHWSIWAFAPGMLPWLVDRGIVGTVDELEPAMLENRNLAKAGAMLRRALIDVGWNPDTRSSTINPGPVIQFIHRHRRVCQGVRGRRTNPSGKMLETRKMDRSPKGEVLRHGYKEVFIDTGFFKDLIAERRSDGHLHLPSNVGPDFVTQLAAEHKVEDEDGVEHWEKIAQKTPNHFLDSTVYAFAAAWSLGLWKQPRRAKAEGDEEADAAPKAKKKPEPSRERTVTARKTGGMFGSRSDRRQGRRGGLAGSSDRRRR